MNYSVSNFESAPSTFDSQIVVMTTESSSTNLFIIHPFHGFVFDYAPIAGALNGMINVLGVQFPWNLPIEERPNDLRQLAEHYVKSIKSIQHSSPYYILAWSLGGLLAVEIVSVFEAAGETVAFLGLIDAQSPRQRELHRQHHIGLREVTEADRAQFWMLLKNRGWKKHFKALSDKTIDHMVSSIIYIRHIIAKGNDKRIDACIHLWSAEADSKNVSPEHDDWMKMTHKNVIVSKIIETDHIGILSHHKFIFSLKSVFSTYERVKT